LTALNKYLPLKTAVLVTKNSEDTIIEDGLEIKVVPVWKWILE